MASRHRLTPAAALAVMSLGASYVPLDPTTPSPRLRQIATTAGLSDVLVPDPGDLGTVGELGLREWGPTAAAEDAGRTGPSPGDPAYVVFTSGSTGEPKGVVVRHAGLVNLLDHMAGAPGLAPGDTLLSVTTPAFDLSVPDMFLPLVVGATAVFVPREDCRDGRALRRWFDVERPALVQATPSSWRLLLAAGWTGDPALRVVCGGEAYEADLARRLVGRTAQTWNFYGPTETTVWSTCARLDSGVSDPVPIGRPIHATRCDVVGPDGEPVADGTVGELVIGGIGVAAGYLGDPARSAEVFVADPHAAGALRYRTGDSVRRDGHGVLTFVGRDDGQVKVRGHRVEVGDVEAALRSVDGVDEAVVVHLDGELRGFVTGTAAGPDVRRAVARRLPEHMVPASIDTLTSFPLTANGKVDRRAVSGSRPAERDAESDSDPTPLEALLTEIWADGLDGTVPRLDDDFFALGGSSLTATRIVTRIGVETGVELRVADLFDAPTVSALSVVVLERMLVDADGGVG